MAIVSLKEFVCHDDIPELFIQLLVAIFRFVCRAILHSNAFERNYEHDEIEISGPSGTFLSRKL